MTMQTMKTTASTGPTTHSRPSSSSTIGWGSTYEEVTASEYGLVENTVWKEEQLCSSLLSLLTCSSPAATHVLRELQQRQNKEDVFLPIQQRAVVEVAVIPGVSKGELQGEGRKLSAHVGSGLGLGSLSAYAQGPTEAGPVDLFQELKATTRN